MTLEKHLLITGCGRSGTKYTSALLANLGLDVPHEKMGKDGIVAWCLAVDCDDSPWGGGRRGITFKKILHQVRHPLKVIPSLTTFTPRSWEFIERHIPCPMDKPTLLRATKYWYYWNAEAERTAHWRYRVEAIDSAFTEFCYHVGVKANRAALRKTSTLSYSRKSRPSLKWARDNLDRLHLGQSTPWLDFMYNRNLSYIGLPFTWDVLEEHAPGWGKRIQELSYHYGYTADDDRVAVGLVREESKDIQHAAVQTI